jgi:hypothetical protein
VELDNKLLGTRNAQCTPHKMYVGSGFKNLSRFLLFPDF